MNCAICVIKECPEGMDCTDIRSDVINVYKDRKNRKILRVASTIDSEFTMRMNRLQELILFCRKMGYRHLGIAFCIGLEKEVKVLYEILAKRFRISSVCCKVCGINRKAFDLPNLKEGKVSATCLYGKRYPVFQIFGCPRDDIGGQRSGFGPQPNWRHLLDPLPEGVLGGVRRISKGGWWIRGSFDGLSTLNYGEKKLS
jgi:hypothetical protein